MTVAAAAWHDIGSERRLLHQIGVRIDAGVWNGNDDALTLAYPMRLGRLEIDEVPLVSTDQLGPLSVGAGVQQVNRQQTARVASAVTS